MKKLKKVRRMSVCVSKLFGCLLDSFVLSSPCSFPPPIYLPVILPSFRKLVALSKSYFLPLTQLHFHFTFPPSFRGRFNQSHTEILYIRRISLPSPLCFPMRNELVRFCGKFIWIGMTSAFWGSARPLSIGDESKSNKRAFVRINKKWPIEMPSHPDFDSVIAGRRRRIDIFTVCQIDGNQRLGRVFGPDISEKKSLKDKILVALTTFLEWMMKDDKLWVIQEQEKPIRMQNCRKKTGI